jgi:porphobilinogen deaminase
MPRLRPADGAEAAVLLGLLGCPAQGVLAVNCREDENEKSAVK